MLFSHSKPRMNNEDMGKNSATHRRFLFKAQIILVVTKLRQSDGFFH